MRYARIFMSVNMDDVRVFVFVTPFISVFVSFQLTNIVHANMCKEVGNSNIVYTLYTHEIELVAFEFIYICVYYLSLCS